MLSQLLYKNGIYFHSIGQGITILKDNSGLWNNYYSTIFLMMGNNISLYRYICRYF